MMLDRKTSSLTPPYWQFKMIKALYIVPMITTYHDYFARIESNPKARYVEVLSPYRINVFSIGSTIIPHDISN